MLIVKSHRLDLWQKNRRFRETDKHHAYEIFDRAGQHVRTIKCAVTVAERYARRYLARPSSMADVIRARA